MMSLQGRFATLLGSVLLAAAVSSPCSAQLTAEISVDVTSDGGLYIYDYTIATSLFSTVGVDWFRLNVANGPGVIEGEDLGFSLRDIDPPENWVGEYSPYRVVYNADFTEIIDVQREPVTGRPIANDMEVTYLAGDGLICDHPSGGVTPGTTQTFTLVSRYAPEEGNYEIGKTDQFCEDFLGFETGEILAPFVPPVSDGPACDFDGDGDCDLADIDSLGAAIATSTDISTYDMNGDDILNRADLQFFLDHELVRKVNGDANFDGEVSFPDFLTMSGNFNQSGATWSQGDFVPNGVVEFPDFLELSANFGRFPAGATASSVPEPAGVTGLLLSMAALFGVARRRR